MSRHRIAILIFLIGASVANFFSAKQAHEHVVYRAAPRPTADPTNPYMPDRIDPYEQQAYNISHRNHESMNDGAWMREALVITVSGVAWFLIPKAA